MGPFFSIEKAQAAAASLRFEGGLDNPLAVTLSDTIVMPLAQIPMIADEMSDESPSALARASGRGRRF